MNAILPTTRNDRYHHDRLRCRTTGRLPVPDGPRRGQPRDGDGPAHRRHHGGTNQHTVYYRLEQGQRKTPPPDLAPLLAVLADAKNLVQESLLRLKEKE